VLLLLTWGPKELRTHRPGRGLLLLLLLLLLRRL
jgi:hypothetical protein